MTSSFLFPNWNSLLQQHLPVINFVNFWCFCMNRFSGAQYWLSSTWRSHQSGTVRLRFSPQWWLFIVCAVHILSHLTNCVSRISSLLAVHTIVVCDPGWISHHWQLLIFTLLWLHASFPTLSTLLRSLKNWEIKDGKCDQISAFFPSAGCVRANNSLGIVCNNHEGAPSVHGPCVTANLACLIPSWQIFCIGTMHSQKLNCKDKWVPLPTAQRWLAGKRFALNNNSANLLAPSWQDRVMRQKVTACIPPSSEIHKLRSSVAICTLCVFLQWNTQIVLSKCITRCNPSF